MKIQEQSHGAVVVLKAAGPLVGADAEEFGRRLLELAAESLGRVVVDAAAIPYVDSRGIEVLLDVTENLAGMGRALKLCAVTATVREALVLTGVASQFEFFDDVNKGVRGFL